MLSKPFLAKCGNRTSMPKAHPHSGSPEVWLSDEVLAQKDYTGISFDFFVNWNANPNVITPVIWIKAILLPQYSYEELLAGLPDILIEEYGERYLSMLSSFAADNEFKVQFVIFRDDLNWSQNDSQLLLITLLNEKVDDTFSFSPELVTIVHLKQLIRDYSGGSIQIGSKGLIYGTSNLECYLSTTDSLYPGDVDLIVLNDEAKPLCILEFKKHTLDTSISHQKLSNYYPHPDGRKYNRLAILKDYLSLRFNNIPLFIIYYPTNAAFTEGRLELLQGIAGNLSTKAASNFTLPADQSLEEHNKILNKLINAITYHNSQAQ